MAKLNCKRIEGLLTDGKEGLGGGEEKFFVRSDGESKREQTQECILLYTNTPLG